MFAKKAITILMLMFLGSGHGLTLVLFFKIKIRFFFLMVGYSTKNINNINFAVFSLARSNAEKQLNVLCAVTSEIHNSTVHRQHSNFD